MKPNTLQIIKQNSSVFVSPDGWAAKYAPDIQKYIGWYLTYVNDTPVSNFDEYDAFRQQCQPGTPITLHFQQKVIIQPSICIKNNSKIEMVLDIFNP